MYRRIALLHLQPHASAADVVAFERELRDIAGRLPDVVNAHLGRHFTNTVGGGDYTWDLAFVDRPHCPPWLDQLRDADHTTLFMRLVARADAVRLIYPA